MQRNVTLDIMKGIGMVAVILGHTYTIPTHPYRNIFFSFHMPLFFILAGYFYKFDQDVKGRLKKDFKRLVVPYILTASLFLVYDFIKACYYHDANCLVFGIISVLYGSGSLHSSIYLSNVPIVGPIWFLLALFWCKVVYNYLIVNNHHANYLVLGIAIAATLLDRYVINLPFSLLPGLSAMVFYVIGVIVKKYSVSWPLITLCIFCWIVSIMYSHIWMAQCHYGFYPIDVLGACGGTAFVYWISTIVRKTCFSHPLSWVGFHSLLILCIHSLDMNFNFCSKCNIPEIWYCQALFKVSFCVIFTIIATRLAFVRRMFGLPS